MEATKGFPSPPLTGPSTRGLGTVEPQPASAAFTAAMRQLTVTRPLPLQSNASHWSTGAPPRAIFTPVTSSAIFTEPSPSQSPSHAGVPAEAEPTANATNMATRN